MFMSSDRRDFPSTAGAPAGTASSSHDPFEGGGEMRERCRAFDWRRTPLGEPAHWPATLRAIVRAALDSPFPINLWCGPDLVLIYNDAYSAVLGGKHPDALGRPGHEVWPEIWENIGPMFTQIADGGPPIYMDDAPFVVQRSGAADQSAEPNAWFTFSLSAVRDAKGTLIAFLNIVSETTPRVLAERALRAARMEAEYAEARLREVFAQAPAFLALLRGEDHVFEYVNAAYYQLVGHRELVGRAVWDALPEIRGQGFEDLLDSVLKTGEPFIGREVPVTVQRTPDSEPEQRFVDLVYYPITEPNGTRSGVVAHGSDVTEHVRARQEAQRARSEAEHANQAKSQFLANMSHEIRTPINAVIGYADLLDAQITGELSQRQREFVDRIRLSSRHLLSIVNDVLDLSKIEAGEMIVASVPTRVDSVIAGAVGMVAQQAEMRGLSLTYSLAERDACFMGDEDRARQIVLNLLSNALKFTPPGGHVNVRARTDSEAPAGIAHAPAESWVVIEVEDTGQGIAPLEVNRIFDAFVQAESGHTRSTGGTGLGLTISRRFARLMGGDMTVRSEEGVGSCFAVWLPGAERRVEPRGDVTATRGYETSTATVGQLILEAAEILEEELVRRLGDIHAQSGVSRDRTELADHTAVFLSAIGRTMTAMAEPSRAAILQDGEDIRALLATRHGRQRKRVGFTREDIRSEYEILADMIDIYLRREAEQRRGLNVNDAIATLHHLFDRACNLSIAAWDAA
jgi:PAS domain S-box-containing protein